MLVECWISISSFDVGRVLVLNNLPASSRKKRRMLSDTPCSSTRPAHAQGLTLFHFQLNVITFSVPPASTFRLDVSTFRGLFGEFHQQERSG